MAVHQIGSTRAATGSIAKSLAISTGGGYACGRAGSQGETIFACHAAGVVSADASSAVVDVATSSGVTLPVNQRKASSASGASGWSRTEATVADGRASRALSIDEVVTEFASSAGWAVGGRVQFTKATVGKSVAASDTSRATVVSSSPASSSTLGGRDTSIATEAS